MASHPQLSKDCFAANRFEKNLSYLQSYAYFPDSQCSRSLSDIIFDRLHLKTRQEAQWPIRLRRRTSDQTVLGSNPAVAAALSPWTRLFTPIVPRRSLHISFY